MIRSKNAGERKVLKAPQVSNENTPAKDGQPAAENDVEDNLDEPPREQGTPQEEAESPQDQKILEDYGDNVQILDLHTTNPIMSYRNNIYSCSWVDTIGTNMFFTKHQETPLHEPEIATEDYDLLGTSRIKLVGHRANIAPKPASKKRPYPEDTSRDEIEPQTEQFVPAGRSLGTIKRTNPRINFEIKQQATFLEKLMDVKKARGESDTVRTFVDRHTIAAESKKKSEAMEVRREIEELNRRVIHGDNEALVRLQVIYSHMEEVESDEEQQASANAMHQTSDPPNI